MLSGMLGWIYNTRVNLQYPTGPPSTATTTHACLQAVPARLLGLWACLGTQTCWGWCRDCKSEKRGDDDGVGDGGGGSGDDGGGDADDDDDDDDDDDEGDEDDEDDDDHHHDGDDDDDDNDGDVGDDRDEGDGGDEWWWPDHAGSTLNLLAVRRYDSL